MKEGLELLYTLQIEDDQIKDIEDTIHQIPKKIEKLEQERDSKKNIIENVKKKRDQNVKQREQLEKDIQLIKEKINKYKEQMNKSTTNKEYQGFIAEIKYEEERIASVEENIIKRMLEFDEIMDEIRERENDFNKIADEYNIKIKDLVDPTEMPFEKTIRRMYILANSMHEDALKALETGDKNLAEKVIEIDDEIDRLNWLVERQAHIVLRDIILCQKLNITLEDASNFKFISRFLERIGDHAVKIAKNVILIDYQKIDKKLYENIMEASEISLELLNKSLDAWLQKDLNLANQNIESIKNLTNACNAIKINPNSEYLVEIGFIIESIRRTGEYSSDISEIIINNLI